ncbi:MAG TPA: UDP-glucose/GDP-mannose dehydrogenase family protein [Vicinamibacterales bacterium]|nr:UDP-glucose/GDP-mannose dehydrogenase family protein [Vicinamibacterales bacterium]
MHIAVLGTGYVGLVSGACLADFGVRVICVDVDADRVAALQAGRIPFYEPGLAEIVQRNVAAGRLEFTGDVAKAVSQSLVIFLAVGTPEGPDGDADLSQIVEAARSIGPHLDGYRVIATKSTVPVGTGTLIEDLLRKCAPEGSSFDVVSNPEFLREGSAVGDFMRPDRVVIGTDSQQAAAIMRDIYRPLYLIETPVVLTSRETAELIKYASNAFLAVKISFVNEIANLCDQVGADVHGVAKGMGLDKRIGPKFLHPGPGYGGSCFPKDTRALAALGRRAGAPQRLTESAIDANNRQRQLTLDKIKRATESVDDPTVAILGLAFKPNTSDVREAPGLHIARELLAGGVNLRLFDPVAIEDARVALGTDAARAVFAADAYEAASGSDAVVIATEWNEFRALDLDRLKAAVRRPVVIDTRNVLDPVLARAKGFDYHCTGREKAFPSQAGNGSPAVFPGPGSRLVAR